ncbi:hypothetical protein FOA52_012756 [Chlamydomonas sp. UWO 241]|nr:hypothetical protein FOA52_012756 [Chlamydomonas sp. UWO 241]
MTIARGCKYRQRTGACCCDNPPIGCMEPDDPRRPDRGSGQQREPRPEQPPPPPPLATEFAMRGSMLMMPSVGWRCSSPAEAAAAIESGIPFLDARGDPEAEAALARATPRAVLATSVPWPAAAAAAVPGGGDGSGGGAVAAGAEATAARLGRALDRVCVYVSAPEGVDVAHAAAVWTAVADTLAARVGALGMECVSADSAGALLRQLQADGARLPSFLLFPTSPSHPHRATIGLCNRLSVLPIATGQCVLQSPPPVGERLLLAWSVARGVPALAGGAGASERQLAAVAGWTPEPLSAADRAELNAMAV